MRSASTDKQQFVQWVFITLREAAWAPLSLFIFYLLARSLRLYDLFPYLDIPTHFIGGIAITYFNRSAIRNSQRIVGDIPFPIQVLLAFTCTGTTIIFWEFYENAADFFFGTQMVRGLGDTITDMLMGLLGALSLSVFHHRRQ